MSDYRENCIKRKLVQRNIIEQRPVANTKPKPKSEWLIVYFSYNARKWSVWNSRGYRTETDARKVLKNISFWSPFIVERSVFDNYYKNYRLEVNDKVSLREEFECQSSYKS